MNVLKLGWERINLVALENMDLHPRDSYTKGWQHESIMLCMCVLFLRPPTFILGFKEDGEPEMNSAWSNISMTVRARDLNLTPFLVHA